ncbi:MAG: bacterial Ig-like domain-containing protein, partial [Clostridia bacterium]|nr:bacterial Ig-like domain-containing protein [Clostridia bacterium]
MKKFLSIFLTVILAVAILTVTAMATTTGITTDSNGIYCSNLLDFNKETNDLWAQYNTETGKWEGKLAWGQYEYQPMGENNKPSSPVLHAYSSYSAHRWSLIEDGEVLHFESTDASIYPGIAFTLDMAQDNVFPIGRETSNPAKAEYAKIRVRNHSVCDQITFGFVLQNTNNGKFVQATITELTEDATGKKYESSGEWQTYTFSMYDVNMNTNYSDLIYDPENEKIDPFSRWGGNLYELLIFPFGYDVTDGSGNYPGAAMDIDYMVVGSRSYVDGYQSALEIKEGNIQSLELVQAPTKNTYRVGEALDLDGLQLKAIYKDGTEETLTTASASVSTFEEVVSSVTLKFGKESVSFPVTVADIEGIEIQKTPDDTVFEVAELADGFVSDGYQIKVKYTDGTSKFSDITPSAENGAELANASFKFVGDFTSAGTKTVTAYYFGKSVTFDITTVQATDVEITASKTYRYNSKPNFDNDFAVTIVFSDGSKVAKADASLELTVASFECDVKTPGTVKAKVVLTNDEYGLSFTKEVDVTVETPTGVEVTKEPKKTEYKPGETFSAAGLQVSLVYADG